MENHDYFDELTKFYKLTFSKIFHKGKMPWCSRISITNSKLFKKSSFDHDKFLLSFNLLTENEKIQFLNILIKNTLIPITPLEIKIILAHHFREDKQKVHLLLFEYKYYFEYYEENNDNFTQIIFHASEYYKDQLENCYFPDELFKQEILEELKKLKFKP